MHFATDPGLHKPFQKVGCHHLSGHLTQRQGGLGCSPCLRQGAAHGWASTGGGEKRWKLGVPRRGQPPGGGDRPAGQEGRGSGRFYFYFLFFCFLFSSPRVEVTAVPPVFQVRMVRGELVDEAGSSALEWIGLIRAARNAQEQTLEAISDLPGGQVPRSRLRAGLAPLSPPCVPSQGS